MFQDSLRSAVYRSLTKTVAAGCQNENLPVSCRTHTEAKTSSTALMTDYLSKSKHFDLDESLAMLSKIQECSKRMSLLKLRQREEMFEEDQIGVEKFMSSKRFSVDGSSRKYKQRSEFAEEEFGASDRMNFRGFGFQESRHSMDGSSRIFVEEENGVEERINSRFSFDESSRFGDLKRMSQLKYKQNSRLAEEEIGVDEIMGSKRIESSRDSIEELRRVIKDSLYQQNLLSRSPEDKKGGRFERFKKLPSSISATPQTKKVTGSNLVAKLMGLEEGPSQTVQQIKQEEKKKRLNVQRPAFEIERPKARKLQWVEKKASPKQKSLEEILEAMQFKGLLKSEQVDVHRIKQLEKHRRNFSFDDELPPIVIMKPLYLPKFSGYEKIGYADLILDEGVSDHGKVLSKPIDRKEAKSIEKAKVEFCNASHKQQRKEGFKTTKKADERPKPVLDVRTEEKKHTKAKRMPISQSNKSYTAPAKSDKRLSTTKHKVSQVKPESKNSANSVKEKNTPRAKSERKSNDILTKDKNFKDGKKANPVHETDVFSKNASSPAEKIPQETQKEGKTCKKENSRENQEPFHEEMPKSTQSVKSPESAKEVINLPDKKSSSTKECVVEDNIMRLLLSSQSFLTRAQELYRIDAHQPINHQTTGIDEDVMRNAKLYLDCGKELMARKSHQHELMPDQTASFSLHELAEEISSKIRILTSYIKVDQSNITSDDVLCSSLERDLRCKDMLVNSMWDIGWITWGYPEEVGEVVCEVEEFILSWLIAEVAIELVC